MSGATRTIQQPIGTGSILAAVGTAAIVVAAAAAIVWASANAGQASKAVPAAAPIYAPLSRDLGSRDIPAAPQGVVLTPPVVGPRGPIGYHGSDAAGFGTVGNQLKDDTNAGRSKNALGYHGFGNGAQSTTTTNASNQGAPAARHAGPRASSSIARSTRSCPCDCHGSRSQTPPRDKNRRAPARRASNSGRPRCRHKSRHA